MEPAVRQKLDALAAKYDRLNEQMAQPEVATDHEQFQKIAKEQAALTEVTRAYRSFLHEEKRRAESVAMLADEHDEEMRELAEIEKAEATEAIAQLEADLKILLLPKDPNDEKNTIVEIRAGAGGDEAGLFVADLFRMYSRYAERNGWKIDVMNSNETGIGGFKEISFKLIGDHVFSQLKFEGGVHRVQRVPQTETQGRVHTSACSVAVLPEAEEIDFQLNESDLQFDVYRSSGPGGQSVNTTDSAVRITHKPTGMIVTCQDEKSQHKNKAKALSVMRARLYAIQQAEEQALRSADRKLQVGSGDRSEKIRTYNYPQDRITDHRIGRTQHSLNIFMDGDIQDMVDALTAADRAERMAEEPAPDPN